MKKITTKLSNLHKFFKVLEYEKEHVLTEDIFIEQLEGDYVKINALVRKRTKMLECKIDNIQNPYICAEKHIIMTPDGWKYMKDAEYVINKFGDALKVLETKSLDEQDSYDVCLDDPHTYVTSNGLVHHNTFCAMYKAIEEVLNKDNPFKQVVVVRSCVPTRDVGFLPGSLEEKQEIYELPYKEICATLFGRPDAWDRLCEQGHTRFLTTTAIRGITIDDAIIIVDECQNLTWMEAFTIATRVGHRSKILFIGDYAQNDLVTKKNDVSGFPLFISILRSLPDYSEVIFTRDDIVRSSFVKNFLIACEDHGAFSTI